MADIEQQTTECLKLELETERRRNAELVEVNKALRRQMGIQQSQIEAEEELITNKLMARIEQIEKEKVMLATKVEAEERKLKQEKQALQEKLENSSSHLDRLKHEKEAILLQVEQEEEFLTNTLQKKLRKVLAEKVDIENRLEQEQEYISNRLQKQVSDTQKEKRELERMLEEEKEKVVSMEEQKQALADQLRSLKLSVECEQEYISNKLDKTVETIMNDKPQLLRKLEQEQHNVAMLSRECEMQRQELRKFQGASYVMQRRIIRESQRLMDMRIKKGLLAQTYEMDLERQLNNMLKQQMGVAIEQPPPRRASSHGSSIPLPDNDGSDEEECFNQPDNNGDVVGELHLSLRDLKYGNRRAHDYGESHSMPSFSPRPSPAVSPHGTPFSSRSHSPINASPNSSRSESPSTRSPSTRSQSSMSSAETLGRGFRVPGIKAASTHFVPVAGMHTAKQGNSPLASGRGGMIQPVKYFTQNPNLPGRSESR